MIIIYLIMIYMAILSIRDFKKAVYITACIFVVQIHLKSGLIQGLRLFYAISIFQMVVYYVKQYNRYTREITYPWLLLLPCLLATVGYFLSSYYGEVKPYLTIFITSLSLFGFPYIFYKSIQTKDDYEKLMKIFMIFFLIVVVFTLFEFIIGKNYYTILVDRLHLNSGYIGLNEKIRYGFRRCNSLFAFCSTLGITSSFTFAVVLFIRTAGKSFNGWIENILLFGLPLCVILTGTRSQYVVFAICLIPFVFWNKTYKNSYFKIAFILALIVFVFMSDKVDIVLDSIFNSNTSEATGSNEDMRLRQFDVCYSYFQFKPIWGYGRGYIQLYVMPYEDELLGAESIWFRMMVDYGIVGCITYLLMIIGVLFWTLKYDIRFVFIPLAFLFGKTVSIVIGIEMTYLYVTAIILVKFNELYKKEIKI